MRSLTRTFGVTAILVKKTLEKDRNGQSPDTTYPVSTDHKCTVNNGMHYAQTY